MAFGFGYNKAKILASAEKNVKQGRLSQAIADYEKIAREDPKDLTVLNTIGDLYARIGNTEQATSYFKRVGDAYAGEGFTVKAIAMYKKLTKQNPGAIEAVAKLAELYSQQGLHTDARAQFMLVADNYLRSGNHEGAASMLQKILDLDPDNAHVQARLAELYIRLGKKAEARDIHFRSAQSLRSRGTLDACDRALAQVLQLDPGYTQAMLLRGQVKLELGDAQGAIQAFEALPDIDSRAEGLRGLLRARLKLKQNTEAEPLARKLLSVFNDPSGIALYADALMNAGAFEEALRFYYEHADQLLRANAPVLLETLHTLIGRVKSNPRSLEILSELFQRAGNTTHQAEVTELLAHAYVQEGALEKARDLYHKLTEMEPENPLHGQNYRQILARLGEDSAIRDLTPEEGAQAFLVDELEQAAPLIEQKYPPDITAALRDALTDSELFASYNLPARAIPPLETVLPRAPRDVQLNQRLASLYARIGRYADAARCCQVLNLVLAEAGHDKEAGEYGDMAARYRDRAGLPAGPPPKAPVQPAAAATAAVEAPPAEVPAAPPPPAEPAVEAAAPATAAAEEAAPVEAAAPAPSGPAISHEIDLSEEWERVLSAEQAGAAAPAPPPAEQASVSVWEAQGEAAAAQAGEAQLDAVVGDLVEEARFYLAQSMWEEARSAVARAEALAPKAPAVAEVRSQLAALAPPPAAVVEPSPAEPPVSVEAPVVPALEEPAVEVAAAVPAEAPTSEPALPIETAEVLEAAEVPVEAPPPEPVEAPEAAAVVAESATLAAAPPAPEIAETEPEIAEEPQPAVVEEPVEAVEEPVEAEAAAPPIPKTAPAEAEPEVATPPPAVEELPAEAVSVAEPEPPAAVPFHVPQPPPLEVVPPIAAAAAAGSELSAPSAMAEAELPPSAPAVAPIQAAPAPADADVLGSFVLDLEESLGDGFAVRPAAAPAPLPAAAPPAMAQPVGVSAASSPFDLAAEASLEAPSPLADLFAEFKQEVESGAQESEDPETHYNLGVAFKEMGLLDEAIGELQKVCQAVERGQEFSQVIEAYTWLADCFLQKGVPEAAIHWYEKALHMPDLGNDRSLAIHYELACAQQAAGNLAAARQHFMHVLSVNIDYRDVAERIKALRS